MRKNWNLPGMKIVAIVNPVAGRGGSPGIWPRLLESSGAAGLRVATWWTAAPGHAETLAARARREGFERVVAVGGDGTLLEVLNGLWWETQGLRPSLGMVPLGTACDYLRNFICGRSLEDNLASAMGEAVAPVSVARARLLGLDGRQYERVFVNVLGMGFDAGVIARLRRQRLRLSGKAAYVLGVLQELRRVQHYRITAELDGRPLRLNAMLLAIGLGRYFGGGMMITPGASPHSQRLQVVLGQRLSRLELLRLLTGIYTGRHLDHSQVFGCYAGHIRVAAEPAALVEAEGELIGRTPLEVEVLPAALRFAGCPRKSANENCA